MTNLYKIVFEKRKKGLKNKDIAKSTGIHPVRLSNILHEVKRANERERKAISAVLEMPVSELFDN